MTDRKLVRLVHIEPEDERRNLRINDVGYVVDDAGHLTLVAWARLEREIAVWSDQLEEADV